MDGKEAIIKRIKSDAEKKAKGLIDSAEKTAEERKTEAQTWAKEYTETQEKILSRDAAETVKRRLTVADLDVRKILLGAKQDVINSVFISVYDKLCSLSKAEYKRLVEKYVEKTADEGDEIVLSCDGVLKAEDVEKFKVFSAKKLSVASKSGDFKGGVYLVGKICDKDLTFKSIIETYKDSLVSEISRELFGD